MSSPPKPAAPGGAPPPSGSFGASFSSDTGAVVRLHSALIAVLTHLVGKLRAVAVRDPQVWSRGMKAMEGKLFVSFL